MIFQMTYLTIKFFNNSFMHLCHKKIDLMLSFNVQNSNEADQVCENLEKLRHIIFFSSSENTPTHTFWTVQSPKTIQIGLYVCVWPLCAPHLKKLRARRFRSLHRVPVSHNPDNPSHSFPTTAHKWWQNRPKKLETGHLSPLMDKLLVGPQFVALFGRTAVNSICIFCLCIVCFGRKGMYKFSEESVVI